MAMCFTFSTSTKASPTRCRVSPKAQRRGARSLQTRIDRAKPLVRMASLSSELVLARRAEARACWLARDIRMLTQWLSHDVLALAGPVLATRQVLFDFIVDELTRREPEDRQRIRPVRIALQNQRDDLLAFAGVLDEELAPSRGCMRFLTPRA